MTISFNKAELTIVVLMRFMGIGGLLAIPAIFFPFAWMNAIHEFMGLGEMPDTPIVNYLARSLSAFYAFAGAIALFVSCDIRRYRSLIRLGAMIVVVMGIVFLGIDITAGLPFSWILGEGPVTIAVGLTVLACQRQIHESTDLVG